MSSLIVLQSDSNELNDVNKRLAKDGMRRDMSIEHKLRYVWRLFQRSESSLKSAVEDVADLQRQQGKDMLEVENYVSHIRKLSDEQKRLTCDYEVENTELKEKIALLKEENLSFSRISDKVTRLLREQDIPEELFTTNTEVQIEYLLNKNRELQSEFSEKFKSLEQENVSTKQILLHISHIADLQSKELKPDLIKEKIAELINSNKKLENENILVKNKITDLSNKGKKTQDILNDIECLFKHSVPNMTQSSLKENIEFVLEENKVLVSELKIKEKELHDYQTEYVKNNTKAFKDMQEENFRLMQKVAMLEEEKSNFKSEIKKKEVLIQNTSKDNHLASKQLQILQEKLKAEKVKHDLELEDMAKSYENELDNTVRNHQTEITNMEEEKNRYNKLIVDLRNMRAKANFLEKDNNLLKQEIKALEIENKSFQNDLVNIKEEQKGLLVKLKKEHEELLSERTTKHSLEVQKLHEQTAARINDYEILKVKNEDNCQQRKALKQRLIYASIELKELKERVHTLTDKNKKVENGLQLEKENSRKYLKRFKELTAVKRHLKVKVKTLNEMLTMQTRLLEKTKTTLLQTEKEVKNKDILYAHMRQNDTNQLLGESRIESVSYKQRVDAESKKHVEMHAGKAIIQNKDLKEQQYFGDMKTLRRENKMLAKQLDELVTKDAVEMEKNNDVLSRLTMLQEEKTGLERVLLTQEEKIQSLQQELVEMKQNCTTLNSTLIESERLNKEMTKKLNEYSDLKRLNEIKAKTILKEKEQLEVKLQSCEDKLQMQEAKFDLLLNKQNDDTDAEKRILKNENMTLSSQLKVTKEELSGANSKLKIQSVKIEQLSRNLTSKQDEKQLSRCEEEKEKLKAELVKQTDKCVMLQKEMQQSKSMRRQTLEQLEARLLKKSADCTALSVGRDTLQNRINTLEEQNNYLSEENNVLSLKYENLDKEVENFKEQKDLYEKQKSLVHTLEEEVRTLTGQLKECKQQINTLRGEVKTFHTENKQKEEVVSSLEYNLERRTEESHMLLQQYKTAQTKLLKLEYQEVNEVTMTLQNQNNALYQEIARLRQILSETEKHHSEEKAKLTEEINNTRNHLKKDRRSLESVKTQLQTQSDLAKNRVENELILEREKEKTCKMLINEKAELMLRILSLEEASSNSSRALQCKENELIYMKNENEELRINISTLNMQLKRLQACCHDNIRFDKQVHSRTSSAETDLRYNPGWKSTKPSSYGTLHKTKKYYMHDSNNIVDTNNNFLYNEINLFDKIKNT